MAASVFLSSELDISIRPQWTEKLHSILWSSLCAKNVAKNAAKCFSLQKLSWLDSRPHTAAAAPYGAGWKEWEMKFYLLDNNIQGSRAGTQVKLRQHGNIVYAMLQGECACFYTHAMHGWACTPHHSFTAAAKEKSVDVPSGFFPGKSFSNQAIAQPAIKPKNC